MGQTSSIQILSKSYICTKNLVHDITLEYLMITIPNEVPLCRTHPGIHNEPTLSLISQTLTKLWQLEGQNPTVRPIQPYFGIFSHNYDYEVSNRQRSLFILRYLIVWSITGSCTGPVQHSIHVVSKPHLRPIEAIQALWKPHTCPWKWKSFTSYMWKGLVAFFTQF